MPLNSENPPFGTPDFLPINTEDNTKPKVIPEIPGILRPTIPPTKAEIEEAENKRFSEPTWPLTEEKSVKDVDLTKVIYFPPESPEDK